MPYCKIIIDTAGFPRLVPHRIGLAQNDSERYYSKRDNFRTQLSTAVLRMSLNANDFRKAMGCFATGVTIITVDQDGDDEVHGMTANAFTAVSLDPVLVLVCVDHRARTHAHLHARKRFGVNVLRSDQQSVSEYYARSAETHQHPQEVGARFDRTAHGTPVLQGALAYLECRLHSTQPAGDHTIFIAEVEEVVVRDGEPLLYFRSEYREVRGER